MNSVSIRKSPVLRVVIVVLLGLCIPVTCGPDQSHHSTTCENWLPAAYGPSGTSLTSGQGALVFGRIGGAASATWRWTGSCWREEAKGSSPLVFGPAIANDPTGGGVLLYGGWDSSAQDALVPRYEAWIFKGSKWTHDVASSAPRLDAPSAVATTNGVLIVGADSSAREETWLWNSSGWTQLHPIDAPPSRWNASLGFDPSTRSVVLSGGWKWPKVSLSDTWIWNGSDWKQIDDPLASSISGILVSDQDSMFLIGQSTTGPQTPLTVWRWHDNQWVYVDAKGSAPELLNEGAVFDGRQILVFGGLDEGRNPGTLSTSEWSWDGTRWTRLH
jgi:hypothetical protein